MSASGSQTSTYYFITDNSLLTARFTNLARTSVLLDTVFTQTSTSTRQHSMDRVLLLGQELNHQIETLLQVHRYEEANVFPQDSREGPTIHQLGRAVIASFGYNEVVVEVWVGFYSQSSYRTSEPHYAVINRDSGACRPIATRMNMTIPAIQHPWRKRPVISVLDYWWNKNWIKP